MLSWFLNPWMLIGSVAVASPILIHLLNKRRFKIVEWAAMDFLFQADKKNRRRVQVENFILLALRCLVMLLIALMLARPFLPSSVTNLLQQSQKLERVIVVDDSMSQSVRRGTSTSFDAAKTSIKELIGRFAESNRTEDWLTVIATSDSETPVLANEPLTLSTLPKLNNIIDQMTCTDGGADYAESLNGVSRYISSQPESGGRAVYLFSDMRRTDWIGAAGSEPEFQPNRLLQAIGESIEGTFVIDTGSANDQNLTVTSVRPTEFPIAGRVIPFAVTVQNHGESQVDQFRVLFQVNDGQPEYETIPTIAPGQIRSVVFRYVFPKSPAGSENGPSNSFANYRIKAEIDRQSLAGDSVSADQLQADSQSLFAARVIDGIPVLLVDGAPSAVSERSESHYLRSLDVTGAGLNTTVITAPELETVSLSDYRVIFLCNVDEVSGDRVDSLRQWVSDGGGLVIMPGDRVRAQTFNETFYQNGDGLAPVKLETIKGDPTLSQWVNFEVDPQIHPSLKLVLESESTSVSKIDVFSWWTSSINSDLIGKTVAVPLRLTDQASSPAMVDRSLGKGNVVFFAFPADADWSMWPTGSTFVPITLSLIDYLVGGANEAGLIGESGIIRYPVDVSVYENRATLTDPAGEKIEAIAAPVKNNDEDATDADSQKSNSSSVLYQVQFPAVTKSGFYDLTLNRTDGQKQSVLFADNVNTHEGDLRRLTAQETGGDFFGDKVSFVTPELLSEQTVKGGSSEIWMQLLYVLFAALMLEQFLGWFWGKKR